MRTAWRIVKEKYATPPANPFDGEGARRAGGRWNTKGQAVVYTAGSLSLAALEMLVHLDDAALLHSYVAISVEIPDLLIHDLDPADLPTGWDASESPPELQAIGTRWLEEAARPVLGVPSAVIVSEFNYVLNPAHPDFPRLRIGRPQPFHFDPRLRKR